MKKTIVVRGVPLLLAAGMIAIPAAALAESGRGLDIGGAVVVKPKYEGSDEYEVFGFPLVFPNFSSASDDENPSAFKRVRERVKIRGIDDVRFRVLDLGRFETGLVGGYLSDRDEDDGDRLGGLGDIDGGLSLGGYAALNVGDWTFDVAAFDKVTGDDAGVQVRLGAELDRQVSERTKITARIGTTFADDDYKQTYFGVTAAQAAASTFGLAPFNAGSGIKDVHLELGAKHALNDRWTLRAGGRYGQLVGDAADSPVIETEDQFSGMLGLTYRFGRGH